MLDRLLGLRNGNFAGPVAPLSHDFYGLYTTEKIARGEMSGHAVRREWEKMSCEYKRKDNPEIDFCCSFCFFLWADSADLLKPWKVQALLLTLHLTAWQNGLERM